jgi:hypothetical protein
MGFKPSIDLQHKAQARRVERVEFKATLVSRKLAAEQRFTGVSKRQAKHDKNSCHKARAWRCKGTFAVPASQVKLSRIDWI